MLKGVDFLYALDFVREISRADSGRGTLSPAFFASSRMQRDFEVQRAAKLNIVRESHGVFAPGANSRADLLSIFGSLACGSSDTAAVRNRLQDRLVRSGRRFRTTTTPAAVFATKRGPLTGSTTF